MTIVFNDVNNDPIVVLEDGINGYAQRVDASNPVDFIDPKNKIVVNADRAMDLGRTVALRLWYAAGRPATAVVLTQAVLTNALGDIGRAICLHLVISVSLHATLDMSMRGTDLLSAVKFSALLGLNAASYHEFAHKLLNRLNQDEEEMAAVTVESKFCLLSFIACALHRETNDAHNWFSDKSTVMNSPTGRICAIAGAQKDEFAAWMALYGHDYCHVLTDDTLANFASHAVGDQTVLMPNDFMYAGRDVTGETLCDILGLPESAKDRYPGSTVGKAGIICGGELMIGVLCDITSKILVNNSAQAEAAVFEIVQYIKTDVKDRDALLKIKAIMEPIVSFAYGYASSCPSLEDMAGNSPSLLAIMRRNQVSVLKGAVLYKRVKDVEADTNATAGMVLSLFKAIGTLTRETVQILPDLTLFDAPDELVIPLTVAQRRVATEERREAREDEEYKAKLAASSYVANI